jgi:hypothetical protein
MSSMGSDKNSIQSKRVSELARQDRASVAKRDRAPFDGDQDCGDKRDETDHRRDTMSKWRRVEVQLRAGKLPPPHRRSWVKDMQKFLRQITPSQ